MARVRGKLRLGHKSAPVRSNLTKAKDGQVRPQSFGWAKYARVLHPASPTTILLNFEKSSLTYIYIYRDIGIDIYIYLKLGCGRYSSRSDSNIEVKTATDIQKASTPLHIPKISPCVFVRLNFGEPRNLATLRGYFEPGEMMWISTSVKLLSTQHFC